MGYVYILKSSKGFYYIGSTSDLKRRLKQHLSGNTYTTRKMEEINLVFSQKFDTLQKARTLEFKLKSFKRKNFIEKIIKDGYIKLLPE